MTSHSNANDGAFKARAKDDFEKAEEESTELWALAKERILQPGVMGGLVGVVNVGLISWYGYTLYTDPFLRRNTRFLATTGVTALMLFGVEGFVADQYAKTPRGREERRRAKREGAAVYRQTKEVVLRPGVLGGLVGLVNVGILGTVGYYAYVNWDMPYWDRQTVGTVSAALLGLSVVEGMLGEKYKDSRH